jgi:hypothetical protein
VADDRVERALEVFVYAPLGLGLWLRDLAPSVIDTVVARGRAEVDRRQEQAQQRITTARSMGQVALAFGVPRLRRHAEQQLQQARSHADRVVDSVVESVAGLTSSNGSNGSTPAAAPANTPAPPPMHAPAPDAEPLASEDAVAAAAVRSRDTAAKSSSSGHLAIPGYDALSASQVVERLVGLNADELSAVREYETSNRNRRTILGKIDQLTTA